MLKKNYADFFTLLKTNFKTYITKALISKTNTAQDTFYRPIDKFS